MPEGKKICGADHIASLSVVQREAKTFHRRREEKILRRLRGEWSAGVTAGWPGGVSPAGGWGNVPRGQRLRSPEYAAGGTPALHV